MDIDKLIKEIRELIKQEAKATFGRKAAAALKDSMLFLDRTEGDLAKWTYLLARKKLSRAAYRDLVEGAGEVFRMHALRQKGVALAAMNEFRDKVLGIIIDKAFSILG